MNLILKNKFCCLSVSLQGAMINKCVFYTSIGEFSPLYRVPWYDENIDSGMKLIDKLAGEFPCFPFGMDRDTQSMVNPWNSIISQIQGKYPHGYGAHAEWNLVEAAETKLIVEVRYPEDSPIISLTRTIWLDDFVPEIYFQVSVKTRESCTLPIGLHPIFDTQNYQVKIAAEFDFGLTFPGDVEAGVSIFKEGVSFSSLSSVPLRSFGTKDISQLPIQENTEELLQLCGINGELLCSFYQNNKCHLLSLSWDKKQFPSCLLWISNRGRSYPPWNNRNLCLGVEPICSAFDMGTAVSCKDNPISQQGIPTAYRFTAYEEHVFDYQIKYLNKE